MEVELEEDLGYSKYSYKNKTGANNRNGTYSKTVNISQGTIELQVSRDWEGNYESQIVRKYQFDISTIEDKFLFLYSQRTSLRNISRVLQEMYGIEVDASRMSWITDKNTASDFSMAKSFAENRLRACDYGCYTL